MIKRQLYQCLHARVRPDDLRIYCWKGHALGRMMETINIKRVIRREPLELGICQTCLDYTSFYDPRDTEDCSLPLQREDRGWIPSELERELLNR